MSEAEIRIDSQTVNGFVTALFTKVGMMEDDAAFFSEALVKTDLWGIGSHGVLRVPIYVKRLQTGAMNPRPQIKTIQSAQGLEVMHGDDGPGFIAGRAAMNRAVELAKTYGVAAVGVIRSNHFGAAGLYSRMAAERGLIGISMANVVQNMVVSGGNKPVVGNNPISFAVPTFDEFPFVLDISMSAVAGGKLLLASKKKEKIPTDWATDKNGRPTDDPDEAFAGFLLPMAGHKGFGLALIVDILCGVITGGAFLHQMKGMYKYPDDPSLTGHFMIAINISAIMAREELKSRMATFYKTIKTSPMWDTSKEMLLPGEIEYRTSSEREKKGIPLPENLYFELVELGKSLGVSNMLRPLNA
jgi:LDH2 family malate/lactate/ureidoglycolate dehydrogenase